MANLKGYTYTNVVIETTDWINEASGGGTATYEDYPYRADISALSMDANFAIDVRFNLDEIESGVFAPVYGSTTDKIMIYASEVPNGDINIPVIICTKMQ